MPQLTKSKEKVTLWYYWNTKANRWEFNHLENGYDPAATRPKPQSKLQENWRFLRWAKEFAWLNTTRAVEYDVRPGESASATASKISAGD